MTVKLSEGGQDHDNTECVNADSGWNDDKDTCLEFFWTMKQRWSRRLYVMSTHTHKKRKKVSFFQKN